ncbi:hypothetical protein HYH03_002680 [Edaphochlamys debaryana]|uniref:Uncharacterized protein n=1 Tax=Edaphochlamys debaryana TaxID=47281 RepID=A0A835YEH9_9CHLO|nr:hypothetical protein HYH03_002680 [Edaphochlamys debaryana]|eukprot:KAG2499748.1 hypothetical protein HYH03_002680 [Edaphochlamys debaryana]
MNRAANPASPDLLSKLELTTQRLASQLRRLNGQEAAGNNFTGGTPLQDSATQGLIRGTDLQVEQQATAAQGGAQASLRRQLRLAELLRRALLRGGAGLEDEEGLAALYAVRTAPSKSQQRLSRLLAAEREAVAAVAEAVAAGPRGVPLGLPLDELAQALRGHSSGPTPPAATGPGTPSGPDAGLGSDPRDENCMPNTDDSSSSNDATGAVSSGVQSDMEVVSQDPLLGPLMAAMTAAGVPVAELGLLPLTPAALRSVLRRHPSAAVRQAAYVHGLTPRLDEALRQYGRVAAVRQEVAAVQGCGSFSEYSFGGGGGGGGLALADAEAVVELLTAVAEDLTPAARAEVTELQAALAEAEASPSAVAHSPHRDASGAQGGAATSARNLEAWDVEYALELHGQRKRLNPEPHELRPYLRLGCVLRGLGALTQRLMGVGLQVLDNLDGNTPAALPQPAADRSRPSSRAQAAPEAEAGADAGRWNPRVVRVAVHGPRGLAGLVYVDPAGGYGTRQIRFPPGGWVEEHAGAGTNGGGGRPEGDALEGTSSYDPLPAVAVGLRWQWRDGCEGSAQALHELLHEMGHALHLTLAPGPLHAPHAPHGQEPSGRAQEGQGPWVQGQSGSAGSDGDGPQPAPAPGPSAAPMHFGALGGLGLDLLELPSSLMQTLAYDPGALAWICRSEAGDGEGATAAGTGLREPGSGAGPGPAPCADSEDQAMPLELRQRVAAGLAAENVGALAVQQKALAALVDQLVHGALLGGAAAQAERAAAVWSTVRGAYSALPTCPATLKELAAIPAVAHHPATFHAYVVALVTASALRLAAPPVPPPAPVPSAATSTTEAAGQAPPPDGFGGSIAPPWDALRREVYEMGSDVDPTERLVTLLTSAAAAWNVGEASAAEVRTHDGPRVQDVAPALAVLARLGRRLVGMEGS